MYNLLNYTLSKKAIINKKNKKSKFNNNNK